MTPEEFRVHGHALVDWIADYRRDIAARPVMATTAPGAVKRALPAEPPATPVAFDAIMRDVDTIIVPALSHWQHPKFFGYFPSNGDLSSVLGDYLSTGLGVLGLSWQSSPALTELEEVACDWLRQMVGLSGGWSGGIQDTASTSTLVALICARERASDFALTRGGLQGLDSPLVVYTSAHAHSSVDKAALLAGFGRDNIRVVPCDASYAMQPDALADLIDRDRRDGKRPCAVVATTGTTTSTALDPVSAIARVARAQNLWLHVDAAMAGSAMILPECRRMWEGIEEADSLVLNVHKWLGVAFDYAPPAGDHGLQQTVDLRQLTLPEDLAARLAMAAELHSATVLKNCLTEVEKLGPAGERIAAHLRTFLASYDMKTIQRLVAQIPVA